MRVRVRVRVRACVCVRNVQLYNFIYAHTSDMSHVCTDYKLLQITYDSHIRTVQCPAAPGTYVRRCRDTLRTVREAVGLYEIGTSKAYRDS